ncbi:MAG: hypothetical protein Q8J78_08060 [Moraxellaceae bacterium]|nr:hypothetical protein [Moraxellaceae bacterium]
MPAADYLEIVETDNGDVVLRRTDTSPGNPEPLVIIRFSGEAKALLGDHLGDIARGMLGTGVQMAGLVMAGNNLLADDDEPRLLH